MMIPRSMLRGFGLNKHSGNGQVIQFHSIRMMLMISSVLPFTTTIQYPHQSHLCRWYTYTSTSTAPALCSKYCKIDRHTLTGLFISVTEDLNVNLREDDKSVKHRKFSEQVAVDFNEDPTTAVHAIQSHAESGFATHIIITNEEAPISVVDVVYRVLSSIPRPEDKTELSAVDLIRLGSVWYLSSADVVKHGTYNPSSGVKPMRLTSPHVVIDNEIPGQEVMTYMMLHAGDYLRIHHSPRRFRMVDDYDWGKYIDNENNIIRDVTEEMCSNTATEYGNIEKEGVIVAADPSKGWVILRKPAGIPVHMTVDNAMENVASCLQRAMITRRSQGTIHKQLDESLSTMSQEVYVATPQRLDQNTSGLLVVATKKLFASYFAKLLRYKTAELLIHHGSENSQSSTILGGVNKLYRCLVCVLSPEAPLMTDSAGLSHNIWSVASAEAELQSYVKEQRVMRHYLEPSIRAPKRFVTERPLASGDDNGNTTSSNEWPEALLNIRKVSRTYAVSGNESSVNFARSLWCSLTPESTSDNEHKECTIPENCQGVVELEIELLTGRTHQIRGQLAACNFPLVGDIQYGGAKQLPNFTRLSLINERLALQCCSLEFIDPDIVPTKPHHDGTFDYQMVRSKRWNSFRTDTAWWTQYLDRYEQDLRSAYDIGSENNSNVNTMSQSSSRGIEMIEITEDSARGTDTKRARPELLPQRVSLSRGANKYVLIRAVHIAAPALEEWFVKSASTKECGGPYHGNVAQDLREWIEAAGYEATVTGGGRIDYRITSEGRRIATLYGFSYGFGRGDHTKAAAIIREWSYGNVETFVDNSDSLY